MNLAQWLARSAARDSYAPALFLGAEQVADYGAFYRRVMGFAGWLQQQGVAPGEHVAIFMRNCPEYLIALFGIWAAGAVAVPVNGKLHGREVDFVMQNSEARMLITDAERAEMVALLPQARIIAPGSAFEAACAGQAAEHIATRSPDDLAWLFYTSGTTGRPKGVMITHGMLAGMALCYGVDVDHVAAQDAALYAAPLSHGAGLYALMHVQAGARHVCPVSGGFDPGEILDLAGALKRVHMFAAPTMVRRLTDHARRAGLRGEGLRTVVYAGGPMYSADIIEAAAWFGPVFVQIYGQGECPMAITALSRDDVTDRQHPEWRARLGSVGRAQALVEVAVVDAAGRPVACGTAGEIVVRGQTVMPGYWRDAAATAATLRDGWLHTGDIGALDGAGYLTLRDRAKDMIITGGSNVYPREVEEVLLTHPEVREVAVVGRNHADWGEEVVAFVVGSAEQAALDDLCLAQIARFKRPKAYLFVDELPKNNYGKVLKTDLRKRLAEAPGADGGA